MMRRMIFTITGLLLVVSLVTSAHGGQEPRSDSSGLNPSEIHALIGKLGSNQFREREAAERKLRSCIEAIPPLKFASISTDPEVAFRAQRILKALKSQMKQQWIQLSTGYGRQGRPDLFVEKYFAFEPDVAYDDAYWNGVRELGQIIFDKAKEHSPLDPEWANQLNSTLKEFDSYKRRRYVITDFPPSRFGFEGAIRTPSIEATSIRNSFVVCRENIVVDTLIANSIVLCHGDIQTGLFLQKSIIVTDGSCEVRKLVENSIIIARKKVTGLNFVTNSVIVSSDSIPGIDGWKKMKSTSVHVADQQATPLGFVRWFDPKDIGFHVTLTNSGVKLEKLNPSFIQGKNPIQPGDVIQTINGAKIGNLEDFRVLLRRGFAEGNCSLTVQRRDAVLEIPLHFLAVEKRVEDTKGPDPLPRMNP